LLSFALVAATATGVCTFRALAEDAQAADSAQHQMMMKDHMMKMKEMMNDPQKMAMMKDQQMKMMVMYKMAMMMAHDPESRKCTRT